MPFTGYPTGSPQAPQAGLPGGGALVPVSVYQQTGAPVGAPSIDGAGQAAQANPAYWDQILQASRSMRDKAGQAMGNVPAGVVSGASRVARYGPGAAAALQQFSAGEPVAALATGGFALGAGKLIGAASRAIPNPLVRGAVQLAGGVLAAPIASQLGQGVGALGNQLIGGAQAAVQGVTGAVTSSQREAGQSGLSGREVGLGGASQTELDRQTALLRQLGVNIPTEALQSQFQITQKYKDADVNRQMALNQQLGQLTGALNRQMATYQIGSQALGESAATTRQILSSNPYAASVLNTGNVRGIS